MAAVTFNDLQLFSVEKLYYPYKYRLYFIDLKTVHEEKPKLHRFCVNTKKQFEGYVLGGVYSVTARGVRVKSSQFLGMKNMDNDFYHSLVYLRDIIYMDKRSGKYVGIKSEKYNTMDYYWDFDELTEIVKNEIPKSTQVLAWVYKAFLYLLTLVIPIAVYALGLYVATSMPAEKTSAFAIPSVAVLMLPIMLWLMNFIYIVGDTIMLGIPNLSAVTIKKYALKWAGMRRDMTVSKRMKTEILRNLCISVGCIVLCLLLNLIF